MQGCWEQHSCSPTSCHHHPPHPAPPVTTTHLQASSLHPPTSLAPHTRPRLRTHVGPHSHIAHNSAFSHHFPACSLLLTCRERLERRCQSNATLCSPAQQEWHELTKVALGTGRIGRASQAPSSQPASSPGLAQPRSAALPCSLAQGWPTTQNRRTRRTQPCHSSCLPTGKSSEV